MAEESHHSIGEVLAMLKDEHSDVTISKIRFFECQGLIDPERTPSGYRKFYDSDIERLRWILTQQRDNFLPLKVIKRRMEDAGFDPAAEIATEDDPLPEPTLFAKRDGVDDADPEEDGAMQPESEVDAETEPEPVAVEVPPAPAVAAGDPLELPAGSVSLTTLELAESADVDLGVIADLERLGLIETVVAGEVDAFDHEALAVARAASVFIARGVEPRHLRMFKVSADRESGVLQQLVGPRLKKGGESQRLARAELNELVQLGEVIHRSILRRNFGNQLD